MRWCKDRCCGILISLGRLKAIKQVGAFQQGQPGSDTVDELSRFGDRIRVLPGKRGLNAFVGTDLDSTLRRHGITHLVLTGAVTSICIDSTARSAYERGLLVTVLEDCTAGRTDVEQEFFCKNIFPSYAQVSDSEHLISELTE